MKKFIYIFIFLFFLVSPTFVFAKEKVNVYIFHGEGCPHCKDELSFLNLLGYKNDHFELKQYEIWNNEENQEFLKKVTKELDIRTSSVPITIINGKILYGFLSTQTTGEQIEKIIEDCWESECEDPLASIIKEEKKEVKKPKTVTEAPSTPSPETTDTVPEKIKVPIFGEINVKNLSLPVFTIILGALDGFNPCAMWVLLFLISLLLGMKDRKRMWLLGSVFVFFSGAVYFVFMAAWLNIFLFLGLIFWIRLAIGGVAFGSGFYHLKEFWANRKGCKIMEDEKRKKTFERLKNITQQKKFLIALGGIVLLAGAVNMVELFCSAGLPAIYTQVLTLNNLSVWQYYIYLLVYIFFYMLDDLVVFIVAMVTLKSIGISTKYARWSNLIGGILMLIIGLLLIFKPGWLMFG